MSSSQSGIALSMSDVEMLMYTRHQLTSWACFSAAAGALFGSGMLLLISATIDHALIARLTSGAIVLLFFVGSLALGVQLLNRTKSKPPTP